MIKHHDDGLNQMLAVSAIRTFFLDFVPPLSTLWQQIFLISSDMDANSGKEAAVPHNIINGTHSQLIAFLVLNIWTSHFALPILLFIVLAKKVQRHATFANLIAASLLYGVPAISSIAAFTLVLQMFLVIRASFYGQSYHERDHVFRTWLMVVAPYAAWLISIVVTAAVGAANPENVSRGRRFFYCSVLSDPLTDTIMIAAALVLFATLALEVATVILFYKGWRKVQQGSSSKGIELNLPLRILSFGLYLVLCMRYISSVIPEAIVKRLFLGYSLSLLSVQSPESPAPDLIIASASSVVVFIFGTQKDIIRVFCFWKKVPRRDSDNSSIGSVEKRELTLD
uniref:G-protein coupled receptors family 1 profile domain-containing protein n=1 Tax=Moniliophthora roreri TaxID=221103 RepID=A0A0W0FKU5_MONRR